MAIKVNITNLGSKFENEQKQFLTILANTQVEELAKETERVIKEKITQSLQRPGSTGNLAFHFYAEKLGNASWGIGNIAVLNANAKYWKWLNYGVAGTGRRIPPPTKGYFSPGIPYPDGSAFRQGRWYTDSKPYLMIPGRPIEAHNYIEKTLAEIPTIIQVILNRK